MLIAFVNFAFIFGLLFFVIIMCADGPADVLDFDDEEFMGGLSIHNIYRRRKTKNLLRALNNGYEPWLLPNSAFRFRLPRNAGAIPIEYVHTDVFSLLF